MAPSVPHSQHPFRRADHRVLVDCHVFFTGCTGKTQCGNRYGTGTKGFILTRPPRPIISYAVGTHGLSQNWAPSIQLENGTDYESSNINAALNRGYAVLITDNPGYTNGEVPSYMVGKAQGKRSGIVTAALQIPNISLKSTRKSVSGVIPRAGSRSMGRPVAAYLRIGY